MLPAEKALQEEAARIQKDLGYGVTPEKAFALAMELRPGLYAQYRAQHQERIDKAES